jgi:Zn-dependent metalloprotease
MTNLPPNFDIEMLPEATDRQKVAWFYKRYVEDFYNEYRFGHFIMAAYAAVPALLTPDLLYKIWLNFNQYQWGKKPIAIHRVAVSDILLSPLCREVGYELYEMDENIRNVFLKWLEIESSGTWKDRLLQPSKNIAAFVDEYHQKINPGEQLWGKTYSERQTLDALNYTQPEAAQETLWRKFREAWAKGQNTEGLRLLHILSLNDGRLDVLYRRNNKNALANLKQNAQFAEAWKSLIHENSQGFLNIIQNRPALRDYIFDEPSEDGQSLKVMMPKDIGRTVEKVKKVTIHALIVAIDKYAGKVGELKGCVNDGLILKESIENYAKTNGIALNLTFLQDKKATYAAVTKALNTFKNVRNDDYCLCFFTGHEAHDKNQTVNDGRHLILYDSRASATQNRDLSQLVLENLFYDIVSQVSAHCLIIFDTHEVQSEQFKKDLFQANLRKNADILRGSMVILNASRVGEQTYEMSINNKQHGAFTYSLVETLRETQYHINYKNLLEKVKLKVKNRHKDQNPFIETFPTKAADFKFLSSDILPSKENFIVAYNEQRNWYINIGNIHGMPLNTEGLYVDLSNGVKVPIKEVFTTFSMLDGLADLDKTKQYEAYFEIPIEPLKISIGDSINAELRVKILEEIAYFKDIIISEDAEFDLQNVNNALILTQKTLITPLFEPINIEGNGVKVFLEKAQQLAIFKSNFEDTNFSNNFLNLDTKILDYQGNTLENNNLNLQEDKSKNVAKFIFTNRENYALWVCVLYFTNDFTIQNLTPSNVLIRPQESYILNYAGSESIPFEIAEVYKNRGIIELMERFKIVVSNEVFSLDFLENNVVPKATVTRAMQTNYDVEKESQKWRSYLIHLTLIDTPTINTIEQKITQLVEKQQIEQAIYLAFNWAKYKKDVEKQGQVWQIWMDWAKNTEGVNRISESLLSLVNTFEFTDNTEGVAQSQSYQSQTQQQQTTQSFYQQADVVQTRKRLIYSSENTTELQKTLIRYEGDPPVADADANAVYDNIGIFLDYLKNDLHWDSLDGNGGDIKVNIHYDKNHSNVFWNGESLCVGDGDGSVFKKFVYSLPVITASLAKGISFVAKLKFKDQSGALSINFADAMASALKQKQLKQSPQEADWLIGEDVYTGTYGGKAFRSLKSPSDKKLVGEAQPEHMKDYQTGEKSQGGAYQNCGILNKAFYFVALELGTQEAFKLWFEAFKLLKTNAKFIDLYKALIKIVPKFYEKNYQKQVLENIEKAFKTVGIIASNDAQIVINAQKALQEKGYYKGATDGIIGAGTKSAIMQFQKDNALLEDGILGDKTLAVLFKKTIKKAAAKKK